MTTDEQLAERAQAGDERAFAQLVERYVRPALALAWEFTDDRDDAEELVQTAFVRVARAFNTYDSARPFRPWFYTILRNIARNYAARRERWPTVPADASLVEPGADPLQDLESEEVWRLVQAGMERLSPHQRTVFRLIDLEGFSGPEVAEMTGMAEATVRVHLHRARVALRELLEPVRNERLET